MDRQIFSFIVFVLLAVTVPILVVSGPDWWHRLGSAVGARPVASTQPAEHPADSKQPAEASPGELALLEAEIRQIPWEAVFRFDITPEEIVRLFPRVSVGLGTLQLQGYRVPLITGTRPEDLAGSLTYYFNARGQVELIEFVGTTGAAGPFVSFCHRRFGLAQRVTSSPGVFYYERPHPRGGPGSYLVIRPAPVLEAESPLGRFSVELRVYNDGFSPAGISPRLVPAGGRSVISFGG